MVWRTGFAGDNIWHCTLQHLVNIYHYIALFLSIRNAWSLWSNTPWIVLVVIIRLLDGKMDDAPPVFPFHDTTVISFCNIFTFFVFLLSQKLQYFSCSSSGFLLHLPHNLLAKQLRMVNYSNYQVTKNVLYLGEILSQQQSWNYWNDGYVRWINICSITLSPGVYHKIPQVTWHQIMIYHR